MQHGRRPVQYCPVVNRPPLTVPAHLADGVASDPDPARRHWLDALPATVASLAARWGLVLGQPYEPGGHCSWVAPARGARGDRLVLKVGWSHPEALAEAEGLRLWNGNGAVCVYADHAQGGTLALLLERCEPGAPLRLLAEPDQDVVLCGLLTRLWRAPPDGHGLPTLQQMCDFWADRFEAGRDGPAGAAVPVADPLDPGLVRTGLELLRALPATADRQAVLATDLHAGNVLAAEREPWLVIDPKPHVGDPAYDALQHMINCGRVLADPPALVQRMAGLLDLSSERLQLWLFARCVLESRGWHSRWSLAEVARRLAP